MFSFAGGAVLLVGVILVVVNAGTDSIAAITMAGGVPGAGNLLFWLLAIGLLIKVPAGHTNVADSKRRRMILSLAALSFSLALLAYFSRAGMSNVGRHIAPFYPFFFALLLCGRRQNLLVSSHAWRWLAAAAVATALVMVIITPSRPLWPAKTLLSRIDEHSPRILQRAKTGYAVYSGRSDALGPLRDSLPPDAKEVGYLNHGASPELPLWKPYMKRRLRHVLPQDTIASLRAEGIRHLILNTEHFEIRRGTTPEDWVQKDGGIVKQRITLHLLAQQQPSEWWVVEIPPTLP